MPAEDDSHTISVTVDGQVESGQVASRTLLVHWLRDTLDKRGPKIGCDSGNCGACTVLWDGLLVKSCMVLAVQADGDAVRTAASLSGTVDELNRLQHCFSEHHALQCGYCTSGMLMTATDLLESGEELTDTTVRRGLKGNICRCTGYHNIVKAIRAADGQNVDGHEAEGHDAEGHDR